MHHLRVLFAVILLAGATPALAQESRSPDPDRRALYARRNGRSSRTRTRAEDDRRLGTARRDRQSSRRRRQPRRRCGRQGACRRLHAAAIDEFAAHHQCRALSEPWLRSAAGFRSGDSGRRELADSRGKPETAGQERHRLIALAKSEPGKLNAGTSGNGSTGHLSLATFNKLAGVSITHVPYRGGVPSLMAAISGEVQLVFSESCRPCRKSATIV